MIDPILNAMSCEEIPNLLWDAKRYAKYMAQLVTRIDEELAKDVDALVSDGVAASRSDAVRLGLVQLIDRHQREVIGLRITDAYRRVPQEDVETAGLDKATRALVEEEPW